MTIKLGFNVVFAYFTLKISHLVSNKLMKIFDILRQF